MSFKTILAAATYLTLLNSTFTAAETTRADADVLATVDGEAAVTVDDVLYYYRNREDPPSTPVTADDVAEVVEGLATSKVLLLEAEERGYGELPYVQKEVALFRRKTLRELMSRTLEKEEPVTEETARAFYEIDTKWRKYADIRCKNREAAEAARRELDAGNPWEDVWARYSVEQAFFPDPGTRDLPMLYDGREASVAAFRTPVGEYAAPAPDNDGIRWHVFRIDKIVHGRIDTFEEARADLTVAVSGLKGIERADKLVAELRETVPINRDAEMWRVLLNEPFTSFGESWGTPTAVVSDVGGIPVFGAEFVFLFCDFLSLRAAGLDEYRARDPDDFVYVADRVLAELEDEALLEYEALKRGLDKDGAYVRDCANRRADLITDIFISRDFIAKLPPLTETDARDYYDAHPERFVIPEILDVYIIAMPDEGKVRAFYERVTAGESIVDVGEAYNRKRGRELTDAYETPPRLPPEKEDCARSFIIYREPNAAEPETALAADLRERVFAQTETGTLSDVFRLADGRWAFYEVRCYRPAGKEDFSEDGIKTKSGKLAWAEYVASKDANRRALEWFASLRANHDVETVPNRFAEVADMVNEL